MSLYDILNINKNASQEDIRKSYKKLALLKHPDKNIDNKVQAEKEFKMISDAYTILSNPDTREQYDSSLNNNFILDIFDIFITNYTLPKSIFADINISIDLPLDALFNGKTLKIKYDRMNLCYLCQGHGSEDKKNYDCNKCMGWGVILRKIKIGKLQQEIQTTCDKCHGKKKNYKLCIVCKGKRYISEEYTTKITIPQYTTNDDIICLKNEGHIISHLENTRWDVKITIKDFGVFYDNIEFKKVNKFDINIRVPITLYETLCGFTKTIKHLNGEDIEISKDRMEDFNETIIIEDRGFHKKGNY